MVKDYGEYVGAGSGVELIETRLWVLTWNIWWQFGPWRERAPLVLDTIRSVDADVVCLQEIWSSDEGNQAAEIAEALGYHHVHEPYMAYGGVEIGNAVLSRWPITASEGIRLVDYESEVGSGDCRALRAAIDGPRGTIDTFCTHLSWRHDESVIRQQQVAALAEFVQVSATAEFPPVVCGDFNADAGTTEIRMMTGGTSVPVPGLVFCDAWRATHPVEPGFTWDNANPFAAEALESNRRLDYVFAGKPLRGGAGQITDAQLVGTETTGGIHPSDHFGVLASIRY